MTKRKLHIVVVDDDRIYQFTARKTMEATGLVEDVLIFSNGKEALDYFQQPHFTDATLPDVIFLDINMPVVDGWKFLEEFGLLSYTGLAFIPIYIVSSSVDEYDMAKAKSLAAVREYIIKPINKDKFRQIFELLQLNS